MADLATQDRVNTPLLTRITQESLDEDYLHVAERRAATGGAGQASRPRWIAAVVVGAFGLLAAIAGVQTSQQSGVADAGRASLIQQINEKRADLADLQSRLVRLREQNVGLQSRYDQANDDLAAAAARSIRLAGQTGFGAVTGPGVRITVNDAPDGSEQVRDSDLSTLVNGLWAAGAEAISINGQRLTARTAIRNSGVAIHVNVRPLSPPYVVSAIGDNQTLQADLLDTASGSEFQTLAQSLGFPVSMENVNQLSLPAAPARMQNLTAAVEGTAKSNLKNQRPKETTP